MKLFAHFTGHYIEYTKYYDGRQEKNGGGKKRDDGLTPQQRKERYAVQIHRPLIINPLSMKNVKIANRIRIIAPTRVCIHLSVQILDSSRRGGRDAAALAEKIKRKAEQ